VPRPPTSSPSHRPSWRRVLRAARWLPLVVLVGLAAVLANAWTAMGHRAVGERLARIQRSPQWHDGHFVNPQPLHNDNGAAMTAMFHASDDASPRQPIPVAPIDPARFATPPASGLRVTWLGHAANLIEIDGARVLTDPVWSERASPLQWIGPQRWYRPQIALAELPPIDAVVISHDHYDHLDMGTIVALKDRQTTFVVPLGIGAHLAYWGVPESKIVELDWWDRMRTKAGAIEIVCTPARHASGRNMLFDRDAKLWAGYAFIGPRHRAFFSGDTGLHPAMRDIGARLGPFDVTMIEVGQYHRAWPDWHIGPEQAVAAHAMLRGKVMLPMHWGLFKLAPHGWTEPIERAVAAGAAAGATIVTPKPGESVEPETRPAVVRWWPSLPWVTAAEHPIVSTQVN
jgi:L-ascorbate metabolism protein UlaG (beta-lactamase superfamily)